MAIGSKWAGNPRPSCNFCGKQIMRTFVDGKTSNGQWGIMCPTCRLAEGAEALGVGLGQKYELIGNDYVRTA